MPLTFTGDTANNLMPCLSCFSRDDLWKTLLYVLSADTEYDISDGHLEELQQAAACLNCDSDTQMFAALVATYIDAYDLDLTADELKEKIKCVKCGDPKLVRAMVLWLIYQSANNQLTR
jgi:hypothetical protein